MTKFKTWAAITLEERALYAQFKFQFAQLGRKLYRSHRAEDGRVTYFVDYYRTTRTYSTLHDVQGHLNSLVTPRPEGGQVAV